MHAAGLLVRLHICIFTTLHGQAQTYSSGSQLCVAKFFLHPLLGSAPQITNRILHKLTACHSASSL